MLVIPRRVNLLNSNDPPGKHAIRRLNEIRDKAAWVLLGEPGAGKSVAFETEAQASGGILISIVKFLSDDPEPSWHGKTLFLDGLDETRASSGDTSVLPKVRAHLRKLGNPKFRIACRAADWFGSTDSQAITDVSSDGQLAVFVLEPLSDTEILEILRQNHGVPDPDVFVDKARRHGIEGLLQNPQTLGLLAASIRDGDLPNTRQETFEFACQKLADEPAKAHRVQWRDRAISIEQILEAAGQLCAALLLSDKAGLALDVESTDAQYPLIDDVLPPEISIAQLATRRKLFIPSPDGEERVIPSHRSVAEYLAARWLARQIDHCGLPLRRILNLLLGRDGRTVAGLRGLYGWLALHCHAARRRLIEADPVTVLVYGDAKPMSVADKRALLLGLEQEAKEHRGFHWNFRSVTPFGALADRGLAPEFTAALTSAARDDASQAFVDCVVDILNEGQSIPELVPHLRSVITDESRWSGVRRCALHAWLKSSPPHEDAIALLDAINDRRVEDSDDELAGNLLRHLYPDAIAPEILMGYLHPPRKRNHIGRHSLFWACDLPRRAPEGHLPILLDQLVARTDLTLSDDCDFSSDNARMFGGLLSRGIEVHGDAITDERLFAWLGIGADKYREARREQEHTQVIASWLEKRPERYKALLALCYRECEHAEHIRACIYEQGHRLHGAQVPEDIGLWHLQEVPITGNALAEIHLWEAVSALIFQRGDSGLRLEMIEAWAKANPQRKHWLEPMLAWEIPDWRQEDAARKKASHITREEQRKQRTSQLFKNFSAIREGSAAPGIMHELAGVWMDHCSDTHGETTAERFESYCDHGSEVLKSAEAGFFSCPLRTDLPSVAEIIGLSIKQREHYIRKPCLVGMELRWRQDVTLVEELSDECLRRMLAFRMTYGADNTPDWFIHLVKTRPPLVAAVLIDYAGATLKARRDYLAEVYALATDPVYREVAELAVPQLLAGFPVRAKANQLSHLERLLKAAMRYTAPQLIGMIANKLNVKGMDVAQRVYWLTTALLLDPPQYEPQLWQTIGKNWIRANHLCAFLEDGFNGISNDYALSPGTLGKLIVLLSPHAEFERRSGLVTAPMRRGDTVRSMVARLGALATDEAESEIGRLLTVSALGKLRPDLESARYQLKLKRREGDFRFPPMSSVARILVNREPTSVADLAALTLDYLDQIADQIRHDNDDGFRAFWNVESKQPTGKREENLCRDALFTRLRLHLAPLGVECQPEGDYANDKRADLRLSYRNELDLPIEIKRDDNYRLWAALRNQLIGQYTRAPRARKHGVYLVLWFGLNDQPRATDGGKKPTSPAELQARLEALLDPEECQRVFVRVLDVSWPK